MPEQWKMPDPPGQEVLVIQDDASRNYRRASPSGMFWMRDDGEEVAWPWLLYHCGRLTAVGYTR